MNVQRETYHHTGKMAAVPATAMAATTPNPTSLLRKMLRCMRGCLRGSFIGSGRVIGVEGSGGGHKEAVLPDLLRSLLLQTLVQSWILNN